MQQTAPDHANRAPVLASVTSQVTYLGEPIEIPLSLADESPATVAVTAAANDKLLIPSLEVSGSGTSRSLLATPSLVALGSADVTVYAVDSAYLQATTTFSMEVRRPFQTPARQLTPPDGEATESFARAIALNGRYALIGAPQQGAEFQPPGAAYLFEQGPAGWNLLARLAPGKPGFAYRFGRAVAIDGDYALVSAQAIGADTGVVFVFQNLAGTWTEVGVFRNSDAAMFDGFGLALDLDGDRAIVGAQLSSSGSGSAYIFERSGDSWTETAILEVEGSVRFGSAVAISGDYALATTVDFDFSPGNVGAAYLFERTGEGWERRDTLLTPDDGVKNRFGTSVAIDGDLIAVGASGANEMGDPMGAVYLFTRSAGDGVWIASDKLRGADVEDGDDFGVDVEVDGDYLVAGASKADGLYPSTGATYVFRRSGSDWAQVAKLTNDDEATRSFGHLLAFDGDRIMVAAPIVEMYDTSASAFIYEK